MDRQAVSAAFFDAARPAFFYKLPIRFLPISIA